MPSIRRAKSAGSPPGVKKSGGGSVLKQSSNTERSASLVAPGRGSRIAGPVHPFSGAAGVRTVRPVVSVPPGRGSKINVPPGFFPSGMGPRVAPAISGSAGHQSKVPASGSAPQQNAGKKAASAVPAGRGSMQSAPRGRSSNPSFKRAVWSSAGAARDANAEPSGSTQPDKGGSSAAAATASSAEALQLKQEPSSSVSHDKAAEKTVAKKLHKRR